MDLLPHPEHDRLARFFRRVCAEGVAWQGEIFRSTTPAYARADDLVSGLGAQRHGGRWNPPGTFATVYGAFTPEGAMAEVLAHFDYFGIAPSRMGRRIFCVLEARLDAVLDLTEGAFRQRLRVSEARMRTTDWRRAVDAGEESITQAIGRAAFGSGLEGLVVPSAPAAGARNLVLFPDNLRPKSILREKEWRIG